MSGSRSELYLSEIFSSFQGEGGTVRGSCFGKRQIFIRFSGCNLYLGDFDSLGCFWCDSPQAREEKNDKFHYEEKPNSQVLNSGRNPVSIFNALQLIKNLITPDLHSISFTGGEPLYQKEQLLKISEHLKKEGINYPLYLETNGSTSINDKLIETLANYFTYCCCDIKDRSSKAASKNLYDKLLTMELDFIKKMVTRGVNTFAKLVITSDTEIEEVRFISKQLSKIQYSDGQVVGLALQPATFKKNDSWMKKSISFEHLTELSQAAATNLPIDCLTLSIQAHKFLNLL